MAGSEFSVAVAHRVGGYRLAPLCSNRPACDAISSQNQRPSTARWRPSCNQRAPGRSQNL